MADQKKIKRGLARSERDRALTLFETLSGGSPRRRRRRYEQAIANYRRLRRESQ